MADTATSIALITKYSTQGFDKVYKADACSSVLAKDSSLVQFTGAKTVKVAKLNFGGLSDYNRNNFGDERVAFDPNSFGYQGAAAGLQWEEHTLRKDRAAKYVIEEFDNEESGDIVIGHALTEINRTQIVPEIDAYCFSEIYKAAGHISNATLEIDANGNVLATGGVAKAPLATLNEGLLWVEEHEVPAENQVIFMSPRYLNALRNTRELTKFMQQGDYDKNVSFTMTKYEGRDLVVVPPARFKTAYNFISTGGLGFVPAQGAADIDFIVMPKDAACHIVKFQKTRILSGDVATAMSNMDGYVLLARIYHDVIIFDNRRVAIYAHTGFNDGITRPDATAFSGTVYYKLDKGSTTSGKVTRIVYTPGDKFVTVGIVAGGTSAGDTATATNFTPLRVGDSVTIASNAIASLGYVDAANKIATTGITSAEGE